MASDLGLHENVARLQAMDGDERELFFQQERFTTCGLCNEYLSWIEWSLTEPTALQSFLWRMYDLHVDAAGEASWNG